MGNTIQHTKWLGKESYHYELIDSTNRKAKELVAEGCTHGTLVTADAQNAGVGRRGRSWSSEPGSGIYMTMVLKPMDLAVDKASMLTLVAAVAVAKAIAKFTEGKNLLPQIKWPNDIVLRGKKVCGILTELVLQGQQMDGIIVGIGINVHNTCFPEELAQTATSIEWELKQTSDVTKCSDDEMRTEKKVTREELLELVLREFEAQYELFMQTQDLSQIAEAYQQMSANIGREVTVLDPQGAYDGIARGITNTGELIVETGAQTKWVSAGEVSVRGIYGYV